jgi:hypothetical protein
VTDLERKQAIYELRQLLKKANRALRDAEDLARLNPWGIWENMATADRIRSIYEQINEDVLEGRMSRPPLLQRLTVAEDNLRIACDRLAELNALDDLLSQFK